MNCFFIPRRLGVCPFWKSCSRCEAGWPNLRMIRTRRFARPCVRLPWRDTYYCSRFFRKNLDAALG
jgi:hypothetical protein